MSTTPLELPVASNIPIPAPDEPWDEPPTDLVFEPRFEYPGADIILRSCDSHHFRVPKSYIVNSSPVLDRLIRRAQDPLDGRDSNGEASLPTVDLPESGAIIHSLLTFVFPITPLIPSTTEETMELLSVAQKYQMISILTHVRGSITRQNPPAYERDTALHIYALAQKYGLRQEALQSARTIFKYPMTIEDLEDKLDIMPGASLYELWKYYEEVQAVLVSDLTEFRTSGAHGTLTDLQCVESSSSQIPCWLDNYIASIAETPHLFDLIEFNTALARHLGNEQRNDRCTCKSIPSQTIRNFWATLASVVDSSFHQAESTLSLVREQEDSQAPASSQSPVSPRSQSPVSPTTSLREPLDVPDANLILRSSDLVNFRVHKPVLAMASPFFKDLFSLPQPPDSESIDGLPVVQLTEDAEVLQSLVSILYPVPAVMPSSHDQVLYLLAACQKYDLVEVQSYVRAEVNRWGSWRFSSPFGNTAFRAYAIASEKRLIPEMENAARRTLDHPMTFQTIGESLRLFQGSALRDLVRFRKRCSDNLVTCLKSFLEVDNAPRRRSSSSSSIWVGCPSSNRSLPAWLCRVLSWNNLKSQVFTHSLPSPSSIRTQYLTAIQSHDDCIFCLRVHTKHGPNFSSQLENRLKQAREKVRADPWLTSEFN